MARPLPAPGARSAHPTRTRLLAAAGMIALLGGTGVIVVTSDGGDEGGSAVPTVATEPAPAPKPARKQPAVVRVTVSGVGAYDPDGDRTENGGDARLATDGDRATAWKSERYRSAFTKSGVGLVVDAGRPVSAKRVTVITDSPGFSAQIRAGSLPTGPFVAVSGTKVTTPRTTFSLRARSSRYLMLWITSMPASGTAAVSEITAVAAG